MNVWIQQLLKHYYLLYIICGLLAVFNVAPATYLLIGCILLGCLEWGLRKKVTGYVVKVEVPIFRWLSQGAMIGVILLLVLLAVKVISQ